MEKHITTPTITLDTNELGLKDFVHIKSKSSLNDRVSLFYEFIETLKRKQELNYHREVISAMERNVLVREPCTGQVKELINFASNNYLGLANHPYVKKQVNKSMQQYGVGLGGPALLNGYTQGMKALEERLASLKKQEDALIFSSGYSANLGMVNSLVRQNDVVLFDELSHASFYDGIRLSRVRSVSFKHNDMDQLRSLLIKHSNQAKGEIFVGVEGVYSMDGDLSPLDEVVLLARKYGAIILLDDAHGTGVLGAKGSGTAEHFDVASDIDISMGTFSKAFAMTGGFVSGDKKVINYLRYYARPYMFSASLPPGILASIHAGLDILEMEPWRRKKLLEISEYTREKLSNYPLYAKPQAGIIALGIPDWMDIRKANFRLFQNGIFVNAIEYPAVPKDKQRFRISLMSDHSKADVDHLIKQLEGLWYDEELCY